MGGDGGCRPSAFCTHVARPPAGWPNATRFGCLTIGGSAAPRAEPLESTLQPPQQLLGHLHALKTQPICQRDYARTDYPT